MGREMSRSGNVVGECWIFRGKCLGKNPGNFLENVQGNFPGECLGEIVRRDFRGNVGVNCPRMPGKEIPWDFIWGND